MSDIPINREFWDRLIREVRVRTRGRADAEELLHAAYLRVNPGNLNDILINPSTLNIDASASYKIDDNFTVTFDGINLTNQQNLQVADSVGQRLYYNHYTGSNYFPGLRYSY